MRQSTESFSKAFDGLSNSMLQIGAGISRSIEVMAQSMMMGFQPVAPINQNLFYQDHEGSAHRCRYAGQNSYNHVYVTTKIECHHSHQTLEVVVYHIVFKAGRQHWKIQIMMLKQDIMYCEHFYRKGLVHIV